MKVICINAGLIMTKSYIINNAKDYLVEGEKYSVVNVVENNLGEVGYILAEVRSPSFKGSFSSERFAPCSDIDETILINNKTQIYEPEFLR